MTLKTYISHPSLVIYFFATPSIKLKLGQQIGEGLLIANHMGQSLWSANQKHWPHKLDHIYYSLFCRCTALLRLSPVTPNCAIMLSPIQFPEPNRRISTFFHRILLCRITYWAPLEILLSASNSIRFSLTYTTCHSIRPNATRLPSEACLRFPSPCERGVHPRPKRFKSIGRCHVQNKVPSFERAIKPGVLITVCQLTLFSVSSRTHLQVQKICARKLDQSSQGTRGFFCFWSQDLQVSIFKLEVFTDSVFLCTWAVYYYTKLLNIVLFIPLHSVKTRELVFFSARTRSVLICNDG
jgi:hypothetical protein